MSSLSVSCAAAPRVPCAPCWFATNPIWPARFSELLKHAPRRGCDARIQAFAHLPMSAPDAAADELERAVRDLGLRGALLNGIVQDRFLGDQMFEPVLARAGRLDVPMPLDVARAPPKKACS